MPESNLNQKNGFTEDVLLPFETRIYYWKILAWCQIAVMATIILFGVYFYIFEIHDVNKDVVFWYIVGGVIALYLAYTGTTRLNSEAQIIVNEKGIETLNTPFASWADVTNDRVITVHYDRNVTTSLEYDVPYASESVEISKLDVSKEQLESILYTYRLRSERKLKSSPK